MNSKEYYKLRHASKMKAKWAFLFKICKGCGKEFKPLNDKYDYCSEQCQKQSELASERIRRQSRSRKDKRNAFLRNKLKTNHEFRLRSIVSKSIWRALKILQKTKGDSVIKFLPYTIPQLKAHIESFFNNSNGYTWENHGAVWHIDHVVPQAMFKYDSLDSKTFRDCWALTNLAPVSKEENYNKGSRRIGYFSNELQGKFLA